MASDENVPQPAPGGGTGSYWAAVAGLVLLVGIVGFALVRRHSPQPSEPGVSVETPDAAEPTLIKVDVPGLLSPEARIMTERYRCVCGCGDRLSVCTCDNKPGSRDMKAYVEELVAAHTSIHDIDQAMIARYGEQVIFSESE